MMKNFDHLIVKNNIPSEPPKGVVLDIHVNGITAHTHGFHKYPGKFIPHIPAWAIRKYIGLEKQAVVFDPFCGSGTTLVEAALSGNYGTGIDIDPLSILISKAKTHVVAKDTLIKTAAHIEKQIKKKNAGVFRPECETLSHWFTDDAVQKIGRIRYAIDNLPSYFGNSGEIKHVQTLWYVCMSSVLRRASNADDQSQKTFVSHTHIKTPIDATEAFIKKMAFYIKRMEGYSKATWKKGYAKAILSDSRNSFPSSICQGAIDLVVTSPPYIKAIDYIYNQMVELFWIGDLFGLQTQKEQNKVKHKYIGNKQISTSHYRNFNATDSPLPDLCPILEQILSTDSKNGKKHAFITNEYFCAMDKHITKISNCLATDKYYVMVVGNCTVSNVFVDVRSMVSNLAEQRGFVISNWWGYKIKNRYMRFDRAGKGGIINYDWVLEMKRTS